MIKSLKQSLDIDLSYSVNSFIYILSGLPILKDLITNDIYSSKTIKKIIKFFVIIFFIVRAISLKFLYFFIIFFLSYRLFENTMVFAYFHIYFFLTILGMFINNKHLNTNKKKYFSLLIFNIDATKFFRANIFWNQLTNLFLNAIIISFFGYLILSPIKYTIMLVVLTFFIRLIGEALNIMFYRKYKYIWYSNNKLYIPVVLICLMLAFMPYFTKTYISLKMIMIITIFVSGMGLIALKYLLEIKDYKLIFKKLSQVVNVMDHKNEKDYLKQAMVAVTEKDKVIDLVKVEGKKGYDFFNTIFFERHKQILLRSAKKYSIILAGIYIVIVYLLLTKDNYYNLVTNFFINRLGWFAIIMFIVNRGAIITQAMFFNCDHAMLRYNFYRERKSLLGLFKRRLVTVTKVNLLPALVIGIGNTILLLLTNNSIMTALIIFLFIISLSIAFSVHYLVIYYLFQPFNKEMEVKKASYSIATFVTYFLTYSVSSINMNPIHMAIVCIIFTIIYVPISLILITKLAPKTFKLN